MLIGFKYYPLPELAKDKAIYRALIHGSFVYDHHGKCWEGHASEICCTHHYQNALEKDFSRDHGMHWKKIENMCSIKEPKLPCLKHLAVIKILWRQRGNIGILPP